MPRSTDKHLILSVSLVNGLRYWSYENFESATEARHNRSHLARRLDYFPLDEIGSGYNLIVCAVDRLADEFDFAASLVCRLAHHVFQFADFVFDYCKRLRQ